MTNNEIIKALERMSAEDADGFSSDILDLIKRQQAEIERLTSYNSTLTLINQDILYALETEITKAKYEAITEFAERLKDYAWYYVVDMTAIDRIAKEMTEGDNGT